MANRKRVPRDLIGTLTLEQMGELLHEAETAGTEMHALIAVGYHYGLRAGEYGRLEMREVHLTKQGPHAPYGEIRIRAEKDSITQWQPIRPELIDLRPIIEAWIDEHPGGDMLFPSPRDRKRGLSRIAFYERFRGLCKDAGLPRRAAYPHVLKSSLASHLFAAGADLKYVQRWLRHKAIASTMRYLYLTPEQERKGLQAMGEIGSALR